MAYFGLQLHPDVATGIPPLQVTAPISQVQSLVLGREREREALWEWSVLVKKTTHVDLARASGPNPNHFCERHYKSMSCILQTEFVIKRSHDVVFLFTSTMFPLLTHLNSKWIFQSIASVTCYAVYTRTTYFSKSPKALSSILTTLV